MARTLEDVMARRTRSLILDARAAMECAPTAVRWMAEELGRDEEWQKRELNQFRELAESSTLA
jgi:glycerol-3-phosphate dehydrogenase